MATTAAAAGKRASVHVAGLLAAMAPAASIGSVGVKTAAAQNMVAYGTDTFTVKDFVRTELMLTAIGFGLVLLLGATYWSWMGYLTK